MRAGNKGNLILYYLYKKIKEKNQKEKPKKKSPKSQKNIP